jgi:hypothetical protein
LALLVFAALMLPGAAAADVRAPVKIAHGVARFDLRSVNPARIQSAVVRTARRTIRLSTARARRAARRGHLRVRVNRRARPVRLVITARKPPRKPRSEPDPTEPAPNEPAPTEPAPTEPAPTEPAPTEPVPTEPVPTEPVPTEPVPTEPVDVGGVSSGFETGNFTEFLGASAWTGTVSVSNDRAYAGSYAAKGVFDGGASGAMRTWHTVDWASGSDVWYGVALYVGDPTAFCYWNPLRWDNYKTYAGAGDVGGLAVERGRVYVMQSLYGGTERELVNGGTLPTGRWTWIEVHQKLSSQSGVALSELYIDGVKKGSSTAPNSAGRVVNHLRYGGVNVAGSCSQPGTIYFDRASHSTRMRGPLR